MAIRKSTFGLSGQVDIVPRRLQLEVTDDFATITTPGYMTEKGISPSSVYPTDVFDVVYDFNEATGTGTYGEFTCTVTVPGVITLVPFGSTSAVTWFTPTVQFGGSSTGITYFFNLGSYTTVGNLLYFSLNITLTSKGVQTGAATVVGVPLVPQNGLIPELLSENVTYTGIPKCVMNPPSSTILLTTSQTDGSLAALTNTNFANNSVLSITGTYIYKTP